MNTRVSPSAYVLDPASDVKAATFPDPLPSPRGRSRWTNSAEATKHAPALPTLAAHLQNERRKETSSLNRSHFYASGSFLPLFVFLPSFSSHALGKKKKNPDGTIDQK